VHCQAQKERTHSNSLRQGWAAVLLSLDIKVTGNGTPQQLHCSALYCTVLCCSIATYCVQFFCTDILLLGRFHTLERCHSQCGDWDSAHHNTVLVPQCTALYCATVL